MRRTLKRKQGWIGGVIFGLLLGTMVVAVAEDITVTTYYPSPRGIYQDLRTTNSFTYTDGNQGAGRVLVSDAAGLAKWAAANDPLLPPLVPSGMVAIFPGGCPAGWSAYGAADGWYLMAGAAHGATGGRPDHFHSITAAEVDHVHTYDPPQFNNSGIAKDHPTAQHSHTVDIEHNHDLGTGGTGSITSGGNSMGDCDNDACESQYQSHTHGLVGQTAFVGWGGPARGTSTTGGHVHSVDVDFPPWDVGPASASISGNTNVEPLNPRFYTVRLCSKN